MENKKWSVYESNLQSYRSCFLSSQSIMLAVGAIVMGKSKLITIGISIIAILQMIIIWIPVIYYRALLVDFHKFNFGKLFDERGDLVKKFVDKKMLTEHIYCHNSVIRKKVNWLYSDKYCEGRQFKNWRHTRVKIDIGLPVSMIIIWVIYVIYELI